MATRLKSVIAFLAVVMVVATAACASEPLAPTPTDTPTDTPTPTPTRPHVNGYLLRVNGEYVAAGQRVIPVTNGEVRVWPMTNPDGRYTRGETVTLKAYSEVSGYEIAEIAWSGVDTDSDTIATLKMARDRDAEVLIPRLVEWPSIRTFHPTSGMAGDRIEVEGAGGSYYTTMGVNESLRSFNLYFNGKNIGLVSCYVNRCHGSFNVPADTLPGQYQVNAEGGSPKIFVVNKPGDYQRAIQDYDKAIQLDPNDAIAYINRSYAYRKLGQDAEADADKAKACSLHSIYCYPIPPPPTDTPIPPPPTDTPIPAPPPAIITYKEIERGGDSIFLEPADCNGEHFDRVTLQKRDRVELSVTAAREVTIVVISPHTGRKTVGKSDKFHDIRFGAMADGKHILIIAADYAQQPYLQCNKRAAHVEYEYVISRPGTK